MAATGAAAPITGAVAASPVLAALHRCAGGELGGRCTVQGTRWYRRRRPLGWCTWFGCSAQTDGRGADCRGGKGTGQLLAFLPLPAANYTRPWPIRRAAPFHLCTSIHPSILAAVACYCSAAGPVISSAVVVEDAAVLRRPSILLLLPSAAALPKNFRPALRCTAPLHRRAHPVCPLTLSRSPPRCLQLHTSSSTLHPLLSFFRFPFAQPQTTAFAIIIACVSDLAVSRTSSPRWSFVRRQRPCAASCVGPLCTRASAHARPFAFASPQLGLSLPRLLFALQERSFTHPHKPIPHTGYPGAHFT